MSCLVAEIFGSEGADFQVPEGSLAYQYVQLVVFG